MIAAALEFFAELVRNSEEAMALETNHADRLDFLYQDRHISVGLDPPPRRHRTDSIESFVRAAKEYGGSDEVSVWVSLESAVCVLWDSVDSHRGESVTLPLSLSPIFGALQKSNHWHDPKPFVDLLRHDFNGAEMLPDVLPAVRNLRFATKSEQTGKHTATSAALGKSIESQVTGDVELPDNVLVRFPPYPDIDDELESTVEVACTLFADPGDGVLKLSPLPGQIAAAHTAAKLFVQEKLRGEFAAAPVYVGVP